MRRICDNQETCINLDRQLVVRLSFPFLFHPAALFSTPHQLLTLLHSLRLKQNRSSHTSGHQRRHRISYDQRIPSSPSSSSPAIIVSAEGFNANRYVSPTSHFYIASVCEPESIVSRSVQLSKLCHALRPGTTTNNKTAKRTETKAPRWMMRKCLFVKNICSNSYSSCSF